jgi:hypothetical protein
MENSLVFLTLIVVLLIVGARYWQSRTITRERRLRYDERGQLVGIGEALGQRPVRLQGKGSEKTGAVRLQAGAYKVQYRFPDDVLVKVDLLTEADAETILLKRGAGDASFDIADDGRYRFDVASTDDESPWQLDITRLGLPSRDIGEPPDW